MVTVLFSHTNALRFLLLFAGACAVVVLAIRKRAGFTLQESTLIPPILIPYLLWMAWTGASLVWSLEPELSRKEFTNELAYTLVAFWFCYLAGQAPGAARALGYGLGAGVAGVSLVAAYDYLFDRGHYEAGFHGGSGNLTSALITLIPCLLLVVWLSREKVVSARAGVLALVCVGLGVLGAYTTLNRTIWIALSIQLCLAGALILWRSRDDRGRRKRKLIGTAVVATVIAIAVVVTVAQVQQQRRELLRQQPGKEAMADPKNDPRLRVWPYVIDIVSERPWLGSGYGRGIARRALHEKFPDREIWHAHNLFLETAIQVGIPGVALLFALISMTAAHGVQYFRSRDPIRAACGIAVLCIVLGMLLRNMTDVLWVRQNSLLYWGIVGMLFGIGRMRVDAGLQR
ncbi:MAG: hypothetical protein A3G25_20310 [Betaproteobacteria bacterium RIFCSPLOWO2_12_FULL_63_13]|nr:MAG: hypothetical protein A3H32_11640 [Betaproteobacteria bacterium RIFCSPLOWO2_02_FULL_63_19]OGA53063.1 MAG: hypothetical protein A3G25_20310 [Betaproteobacteria bacterium RIFCSPLOWO2_12_FULL_63_13]